MEFFGILLTKLINRDQHALILTALIILLFIGLFESSVAQEYTCMDYHSTNITLFYITLHICVCVCVYVGRGG